MKQLKCPKCGGKARIYKDIRWKIQCFNCGYEDYMLNLKLKKDVREMPNDKN